MKESYPIRDDGIAVSPLEMNLPEGKAKRKNNHHIHFYSNEFAKHALTLYVRDLECHQLKLPIDIHQYIHKKYDSPKLPTEEQAAREIIRAYEEGILLKRYDTSARIQVYSEIPRKLVDELAAKYKPSRIISVPAD